MVMNLPTTLDLKEDQLEYLDSMVKKHNLPDRSKALRCLITFAMLETEQEVSIFTKPRCTNC